MVLPSGASTTLKEGDAVVQRGTLHQWWNKSETWCRLCVMTIAANDVKFADGKEIEGLHRL